MSMENDRFNMPRRGFVVLTASTLSGSVLAQSGDSGEPRGAAVLVGSEDNRPPPGDPFFDKKLAYHYIYESLDTGERWLIETGDGAWQSLTASGKSPWGDDDSDDLLELPNHQGIDVQTTAVGDHQHEKGSFSMSGTSSGTESISFTNTYDPNWISNSVGVDVSGGLTGVVIAFWANYDTDSSNNIDGMEVAWRNETTGDRTARWEVDGMAP